MFVGFRYSGVGFLDKSVMSSHARYKRYFAASACEYDSLIKTYQVSGFSSFF
jgi:hypothetical protein